MWMKKLAVPLVALSLFATGCESMGDMGPKTNQPQPIASNVNGMGTIAAIDIVPRTQGLGLGALAGVAIGGVLGNQVGGGRGNTVTTVAGAAGGAYVGHELEKKQRADNKIYKVTIRMDDGTTQSFAQELAPTLHAGQRVSISNGVLSPL
jgi:outer membrane lipoprotein SlyB